jgi:hypothetical protein
VVRQSSRKLGRPPLAEQAAGEITGKFGFVLPKRCDGVSAKT